MTGRDARLDPGVAALLTFLEESGSRPLAEGTVGEARRAFRTLAVDLRDPAAVPGVASVEDITVPGAVGDLAARVYRPRDGVPLPTVLLFHGGGFVIGDLDTHDLTARTLAVQCDAVVVSVDYRLAPEHPFPAPTDDAVAVALWAAARLADLGGTDRLAVAGDSAGANLSAVVAQEFRDRGLPLAGQLLFYPATDFLGDYPSREENAVGYFLDLPTMAWFMEQYVGHLAPADLVDPRLSPRRGRLEGLAPAVVAAAQFDPLRDEGAAYAQALAEAGTPTRFRCFDGLIHGFTDMGRYSQAARAAVEETCALFREVLHA